MSTSKRYGVLLTEDGATQLELVLKIYLRQNQLGTYLNCKSVDPNGTLFHLVAEPNELSKSAMDAEVQIPHAYVKLVLSTVSKNPLGFGDL